MNIQAIKRLTWLGALGLGGTLGWDVWQFLENKVEYEKYVSREEIDRALVDQVQETESVDPNPTVKVKDLTSVYFTMNWTGKEKRKTPTPGPTTEKPQEAPQIAVADLLTVQYIQWSPEPEDSVAFVVFLDAELKTLMDEPKDRLLEVGERLVGKHAHMEVAKIEQDGILFKFDDKEREPELVVYSEFATEGVGIVVVGKGGARAYKRPTLISQAVTRGGRGSRNPKLTTLIRTNEFQIGTETLETFDSDYPRILAEDLRYRSAHDPATGKIRGIQVTEVAAGSLPAQHGVTAGEILISINGHKVKSINDAVAYVKKEADTQSTWDAVFEKDGRQFTRTYHSPEE